MDFEVARARLIDQLAAEIQDRRVLSAMSRVSRELFVPSHLAHMAYEDGPLPIGLNQTISQPYIVALMTEKLELAGSEKVLELGTGSGYQTAILAELALHVVTTERLSELMEKARANLEQLGYKNIEMHLAEETLGWKDGAPYDAIIATAGAPRLPHELVTQLALEGRMVIPIGSRYNQELYKVIRHKKGNELINLGGCRFVSLIGKDAWEEENDSKTCEENK
jgi:protein-L-isoaspartate(D-aspartate) O-methyltransferase